MRLVETHAHIYAKEFDEDRDHCIERAQSGGVEKIIMPNIDHESIDPMMELEEKYPGFCEAMMGLHPCYVKKDFEKELYIVEEWISKRDFVAIGEIGMDLYWDQSFKEQQIEAFNIQAEWAKKKKWPICIHSRDSNQEVIELVQKAKDDDLRGVFHCFSGTEEEAQQMIELDFYLGIGGVVTFKNAGLDKVVANLPLERLILETDCPYLPPVPHRGKRNEPGYLPLVLQKIADVHQKSIEEVAEITTRNAYQLFDQINAGEANS